MNKRIPVTVLTGFLGSGKTTLLNRILSESHGKRIAVIENEFGEIGIDQALVINADEEVFEMNNGCICCTVRGDLIRILGSLIKRRDKFDQILIETTGLADPSPVAQTFYVDDELRELFVLDGIVTLVDAKHLNLHLDSSNECREQVAFADVIVLNKLDLVSLQEAELLEQRIRGINCLARVIRATNAAVPVADVVDIGGFDLKRALIQKPTFLEPEYPFEWAGTFGFAKGIVTLRLSDGPDPSMDLLVLPLAADERADSPAPRERAARTWSTPKRELLPGATLQAAGAQPSALLLSAHGLKEFCLRVEEAGRFGLYTQHLPAEFSLRVMQGVDVAPLFEKQFVAGHSHDDEITSVGLHLDGALDGDKLNQWLSELLRRKGTDIFRMKGILNIEGSAKRFVFQGVHMLLDGKEDRLWGNERRTSDIVFIGRGLDRQALVRGFESCLA